MRIFETVKKKETDWWLVACYLILIIIGWVNIYSSIHGSSESFSLFDLQGRSGKQFLFIGVCLIIAALMLFVLSPRLYEGISLPLYAFVFFLLIAVIFLAHDIKGSRSWIELGFFSFQPAEFSKISTSLLLARVMSQYGFNIRSLRDFLITALIIIAPMAVIFFQHETGLAMVYACFIFVLYREGLSGWFLFILGMIIILFILTLVASPYAAIMVAAVVATLCNSLYTKSMKRWWALYFPSLLVLGAIGFLPRIFAGGAAEEIQIEEAIDPSIIEPLLVEQPSEIGTFLAGFNPVYILIGVCVIAIPIILYRAYKRNTLSITAPVAITFIAGVLLVFSTDFIFDHALKEYQRERVEVVLGIKEDPAGVGYNVNQSEIAIGSGGFIGKGFLNGTQTTYGFVPEQSTDFIFCTIGEEWGFLGSVIIILIYVFMISRIIIGAERSNEAFTRIYGYCVASCFFMHLFINIGMTIGIMPVIGIPLPFLSYGGSSLLTFTILLFIFIVLKRNESQR